MNAAKQAAWLFMVLIALACSGWYFASSKPALRLDDNTLSTTPDAIIQRLTVRQFDAQGKLINYLKTPLVHHIPAEDTHWFKNPYIIITQEDQSAWEIHSRQATSIHGGEEVTFKQQVVIHQGQSERPDSTLKTEEVTYFPKRKYATTQHEVLFQQAGNVVQSTGMNAYLEEKRVQLLSKARGTYDPNQG